jgi:hypothetical protein
MLQGRKRIFGLDTEYGITVNGTESVDIVAESIELIRGYTQHGAQTVAQTVAKSSSKRGRQPGGI